MIKAGARAPAFELPDQDGNAVSLEGLAGLRVLLVFYPLDFSPVCTDQLTVYDRDLPGLAERGVHLYGVSVDSAYCHAAFRERLGVTMPLLADFNPKGAVARAYGVYSDDHGVAVRALVLIGPDGTVEWSHRSPSPLEVPGTDLILAALGERAA
ncbi:MAG TPA: redoxin domain-containing protein [Thermoleophilaceae bacterium]|nr:redoxin domain-containing protein [Thermoleophilaceae bacterium]